VDLARYLSFVLALGIWCLPGCSRGDKSDEVSPRASPSSGALTPESADTSLIVDSGVNPAEALLAVVTYDGRLIPIALRGAQKQWFNPWSEPAYEGAIPARPLRLVPRRWFFFSADGRAPASGFFLKALVLGEALCGRNWAFSTDLKPRTGEDTGGPGRIIGIAFSLGVERLAAEQEKAQAENFNAVREQFSSLLNTSEGQSAARFLMLGYFRLFESEIGVGLSEGESAERYEVFEIRPDQWKLLIEVDGGRCGE